MRPTARKGPDSASSKVLAPRRLFAASLARRLPFDNEAPGKPGVRARDAVRARDVSRGACSACADPHSPAEPRSARPRERASIDATPNDRRRAGDGSTRDAEVDGAHVAGLLAAFVALALASACAAAEVDPTYYPTGIEPPQLAQPGIAAASAVKVAMLVLLAAAGFAVVNWTARDTRFVGTDRVTWGLVVLGGVAAGLAAAVLVPLFALGWPLGVILTGGGTLLYVQHRNGLVTAPLKVLTPAHLARLRRRLGGKRASANDGPVTSVGRDIVFVGVDDLPIRPQAADTQEHQAVMEVERIIFDAIARRATSVGYLARSHGGDVRLRIDGEMTSGGEVPHPVSDRVVHVFKQLAGLDPHEVRRPQDGRFRAIVGGRTYDIRTRTAGTVKGEQVALRVIDTGAQQRRLEDLGLTEEHHQALVSALAQRPAIVVLSAPKDSGLTTTLHACLRQYDRYMNNVLVFEPHVDAEIENVTHVVLAQEDGPLAAAEVRSRVRMEPDVVAVDALYLPEVAQVLAEAAADHTILVGLRATDTTQALARLAEMMSDRAALASRLRIIVSQRLVRLLCPDCKEAYRPNPEFLRKANLGARRVDVLYRPPARPAVEKDKVVVCPRCHNDRYIGRTGLFEVMVVDPEMADLIAAGAGPADLRTHARKFGLRNLQEEGLELVTRGETSIEEVLRAIKMEA